MARTIYTDSLLRSAASLITEDNVPEADKNPEYDRALVELVGDVLGLDHDHEAARTAIEQLLRSL